MHRSTRSFVAGLAIAAGAWLVAGSALAQEAPPAARVLNRVLNIEQARGAFSAAGYQVDQALNWEWTSPPVSTFQVHDLANGRVLMVMVYPDAAGAQTGWRQALAREPQQSPAGVVAASDPHLIAGYGKSVWSGNVAMVQATQAKLDRVYQLQADRDNGIYVDPDLVQEPTFPDLVVDLDFQQALQSGAVNL
jgi:hypothetical protein